MSTQFPPAEQRAALRWLLLGLVAAAAVTLSPLWVSLILGAWFAALTRPLLERLMGVLGGRPRAAAVLTVGLLLLLLLPLVVIGISVGTGAVEFVHRITSSEGGKSALVRLVSDQPSPGELPGFRVDSLISLLQQHGAKAWSFLRILAGKAATWLLGLFLFLMASYTFLIHGARFASWIEARVPIAPAHLRRLSAAFYETGKGLVVGVGLTGLTQGVIATIAYFALSIPSALVLGILTAIASIIPPVGTALVWVPVTVGLALKGRWVAAIILASIGLLVIGLVDNVMRPIFARYGRLNLPTFVLFLSLFGGLALYGAAGILLGPLLVRLGVEALNIAYDAELTPASESRDDAEGAARAEEELSRRPAAPDDSPPTVGAC